MKKDHREYIIKKTISLIAKKGFEASGMKEIAEVCKMSPASIYYYFDSKRDLLLKSIAYVAYKLEATFEKNVHHETLEESYKATAKSVVKFIKHNVSEAIFYSHMLNTPQAFPYTKAEIRGILEKCPMIKMLVNGVESGELHNLPNIATFAYSPIYPYVLNNLNITPEQEDLFIDRLWYAISTGRVREQALT